MKSMKRLKVGDRVKTEDGDGKIVEAKYFNRIKAWRFGVSHDSQPDWQAYGSGTGPTPTWYFENELRLL
jgi:hypothetical protein